MHAPQEPLTRPGKASGGRTPSLRTRSTPPERTLTSLRARCLSAMRVQRRVSTLHRTLGGLPSTTPSAASTAAPPADSGYAYGSASRRTGAAAAGAQDRPLLADHRDGPEVLVASGARKGHPEGHVPAWSFAGRRRKQLWPRDRPQPQARVSCGCRRVRAMRDAVRCCARRARARNLAISIVIVQYQRNM